MAMALDMSGRVVLVCGAARGGIGGATARGLARAGATLVLVDKDRDIVEASRADVAQLGATAHALVCDLMDPDASDAIVPAVYERFGRLDGVANVAGGTRENEWLALEETTTAMFRDTFALNCDYVFRICRDAAKAMIAHEAFGAMVNVTSVSSLTSAPFHGPYGAAKSGIAALTRTMAFEWARYGIRANAVAPGAVPTERVMSRVGTTAPSGSMEASDIVPTTVDEMANAIIFLLSDLASGISGQHLVVDSGLSTRFAGGPRRMDARKPAPVVAA